jgi:hypothetical protein
LDNIKTVQAINRSGEMTQSGRLGEVGVEMGFTLKRVLKN